MNINFSYKKERFFKLNELRNAIRKEKPEDAISLSRFIEEKRLLKTKVKLLHILLLDEDIKGLEKENLTLPDLTLEDIYLTTKMHIIAPIESKIIPITPNDLKRKTYLIYLSYLYNINLLDIYQNNPSLLWQILSRIDTSPNIKHNLYTLLTQNKGEYFSTYLEELNSPEYRMKQESDILTLKKCQHYK